MNEFSLINKLIKPIASKFHESQLLQDDVAKINIDSYKNSQEIVITKDILVENVHFFVGDGAKNIAKKIVAVNLSDIASAGARPLYYLLGIGKKNQIDDNFWQIFFREIKKTNKKYNIGLIGGDTVSSRELFFSVTAIGEVEKGKNLLRSNAKNGDLIWVSNFIGDAFLGLKIMEKLFNTANYLDNKNIYKNIYCSNKVQKYFMNKYQSPTPQIKLGRALVEKSISNCACDISDGLLMDVANIAKASNLQANLFLDKIPFSNYSKAIIKQIAKNNKINYVQRKLDLISGGDDYQLIFTTSSDKKKQVEELSKELKIKLSHIGEMSKIKQQLKKDEKTKSKYYINLLNNSLENKKIKINKIGYEH
ncbi:MAG: thiamine-phosphate kinase [Rickettsiales bacterium]|jgi:thiamine-monophosphate kinase|nr:thiamine-phosphate kinase [Rickettsiales bacterium]